jgi:acylphosphatase
MANDAVTLHLEITGLVQGVGYRQSMQSVAGAGGVSGWVRNRTDGSVEAMVQGSQADIERLLAWCHDGPPGAKVRGVLVEPRDRVETMSGFVCRASL